MTSFAVDIAPLFTPVDINCMRSKGVRLANYEYMSDPVGDDVFPDHANSRHVYARLTGAEERRMPLGGPYWSDELLDRFNNWMTEGFAP